MSIRTSLLDAQAGLTQALGLDEREARIEAQVLLRHALGSISRAWLIAHEQDVLSSQCNEQFQNLLARRLAGEPVAYILGEREFFGLAFNVSPAVLIPRPDTELLVELALEKIPQDENCKVLDLGAGSGAIAISIASRRPQAGVVAVDASNAALAVAQGNAEKLNTPNVQMLHGNWFVPVTGQRFDVIASNPPYIAQGDAHLTQGDLRFEPVSALTSGPDGLDDIRWIVQQAPEYLHPSGWLMLEHGYDQAEKVAQLLRAQGFSAVESRPDLAGVMRVTLGQLM